MVNKRNYMITSESVTEGHPDKVCDQISDAILDELIKHGFDSEKSKDLLTEWVKKLDLQYNSWGHRCKIIPMGHNIGQFDIPFLKRWLGVEEYGEIFYPIYRDTMVIASYINDNNCMHAEKIQFPKVNLTYLCNLLNVDTVRAHDALADCVSVAEVYKKLLHFTVI